MQRKVYGTIETLCNEKKRKKRNQPMNNGLRVEMNRCNPHYWHADFFFLLHLVQISVASRFFA